MASGKRRPQATSVPSFAGTPDTAHEWLTFDDDEEDRSWVVDVTFLLSGWSCIFGRGCQGVLTGPAPALVQGCCSYGAHFTDDEDVQRVKEAARALRPDQWQFHAKANRGVIKTDDQGTSVTRLVDGACIFLNRPGFAAGAGCALHVAAIEQGRPPLELKPDVCWQLPLRREDDVDEETGHVTSVVTQWERRHWGDGGFEFHWWCTEAPEAFAGRQPVYRSMAAELEALVGPVAYPRIVAYLDQRTASPDVVLPHPTVRTK